MGWPTRRRGSLEDRHLLPHSRLPDRQHVGTHVDALCHYDSRAGAPCINKLPLETFLTDGVCIDISHRNTNTFITVSRFENRLKKANFSQERRHLPLLAELLRRKEEPNWLRRIRRPRLGRRQWPPIAVWSTSVRSAPASRAPPPSPSSQSWLSPPTAPRLTPWSHDTGVPRKVERVAGKRVPLPRPAVTSCRRRRLPNPAVALLNSESGRTPRPWQASRCSSSSSAASQSAHL